MEALDIDRLTTDFVMISLAISATFAIDICFFFLAKIPRSFIFENLKMSPCAIEKL